MQRYYLELIEEHEAVTITVFILMQRSFPNSSVFSRSFLKVASMTTGSTP